MRISDWSSDVCSSDLAEAARPVLLGHARPIVRKLDHISAILRPPTRPLDPRESIGRAVLYGICDQFVQDEAHVQRPVAVHRAFLQLKLAECVVGQRFPPSTAPPAKLTAAVSTGQAGHAAP